MLKMTPNLISQTRYTRQPLIDLASKDSSYQLVNMWQGKSLEIIPEKIKSLFTFGLCGCQATSIIAKGKNGNPIAIMTHFPPISLESNIKELQRLIDSNKYLIDNNCKPQVGIVVPGEYRKNAKGTWELVANNTKLVEQIENCIKKNFSQGIETKILPYSELSSMGSSNSGVYKIDFPTKKGQPIRFMLNGSSYGDFGSIE